MRNLRIVIQCGFSSGSRQSEDEDYVTMCLMSGVSPLWTDLDLRSQHQPRTSGVRKGKQRIRRRKAARDTRGLAHFTFTIHLWPRPRRPGYLACASGGECNWNMPLIALMHWCLLVGINVHFQIITTREPKILFYSRILSKFKIQVCNTH